MTAMEHATAGERKFARRLIAEILGTGNLISVHDGEEWAIRLSADRSAIEAELAHTDQDYVHVSTPDACGVGGFDLIWGNDPDGSELIADHSDNTYCNAIWNTVHERTAQ